MQDAATGTSLLPLNSTALFFALMQTPNLWHYACYIFHSQA